MISEFRLMNWRSAERTRLFFDRKNIFTGPNGSGKSNLLEALGFLGVLRSFRTLRTGELIRRECSEFHLRGVWNELNKSPLKLEVSMNCSGERTLRVNDIKESSGRDFIQHFFPVVFAPEDMEVICGAPAVRRRFFDMLSSQLDDGYINVLHDYLKALKLRNTLLKNPRKVDTEKLEVYEGMLAFAAADITARRQKYIAEFNRVLSSLAPESNALISVEYLPQCSGDAGSFLAAFARSRSREIEKRTTLVGCHLDDYRFYRNKILMKGFASNGQNRMAALNCKLASALMLMEKRGSEKLIALVDDVTGELDKVHREIFFRMLAPAGQIFFTCTEIPADELFRDAKILKMPDALSGK